MPLNPASAGARGARQASTAGQLRRRALEAAARRSPFANLPLCLGGTQSSRAATVARAGGEFVKSELCPTQLPGVRASARDSRRFGLARIRPDKAYELRWKQLMSQLGGSGTSQGFVARVSSVVKSAAARWSERRAQHMSQPAAAIADWLRQHDLSDFDLVIASDLSAAQ